MPHRKLFAQSQEVIGDVAAAGSAAFAGFTWVAQVNELLQLAATVIAIVAGVYAIKWHRVRISDSELKRRLRNASTRTYESESPQDGDE